MNRILFAGLLLAFLTFPLRAEDDAAAQKLFDQLLAADDADDYDAFVANADDVLKAGLTKTQFDASSELMKEKSKDGREVKFLGELNQHGYEVYLYRLRCKDGDMLATMALKDGKVAGIYFK